MYILWEHKYKMCFFIQSSFTWDWHDATRQSKKNIAIPSKPINETQHST